jgi:L-ascorbate metabolism protein UlaG (beta-lactamase superfamily)
MFLGHSGIFAKAKRAALVIDPCIDSFADSDRSRNPYSIINKSNAVLISHSHWDHMPLSTLLRIRRDMLFLVPRCSSPSPANPPIATYLKELGFTKVREVSAWESIAVEDIKIVLYPFYGESFGLASIFDGLTYFVDVGKISFYGSVDSCHDERGDMDEVYRSIKRAATPDLYLFGASNQAHMNGVAASYPRYLSNELESYPHLLRYHANVIDVERWIDILKPALAMPYAEFIFDGCKRADVELNKVLSKEVDTIKDYWNADLPASLKDGVVIKWQRQLEYLSRRNSTTLLMLHPMQGLRI